MRTMPVVVFVALVATGCPTRPLQFPEEVRTIRTVAIMPPAVDMVRIVFSGDDESLQTEAQTAARAVPGMLAPLLERHGFTVVPARLDEPDLTAKPELRYPLTLVKNRTVGAAVAAMRGQQLGGLGPELGQLADHAGADGMVFVVVAGLTKSAGQITRDVVVSVLTLGGVIYGTGATRAFVGLADGRTGAIHWWSYRGADAFVYEGPALERLVQATMERWPSLPSAPQSTKAPLGDAQ